MALAPLTTFEVGGEARYFAVVRDVAELEAAFAWASERVPVILLGGGSNVVIADRGLDALVLRYADESVRDVPSDDLVHVRAGAGVAWDAFVGACVARNLAGLECLSGIPGSAGATPIQNVGAYGQEVGEVVVDVELFRPALSGSAPSGGEGACVERWSKDRCGFSYRDSVLKRTPRGAFVVLGVTFGLRPDGEPALRYAELARSFGVGERPTLAEVRARVLELRRAKSMVWDASDENHRSAGSFFTNPIVASEQVLDVRERARSLGSLAEGEAMPSFAAGEGRTKLSAGWLIERAGFPRGTSRGAVGLSSKHALAVVNRGGATARQVVAFAREVQAGVLARLGVRLEPEPELLGFSSEELGELARAT